GHCKTWTAKAGPIEVPLDANHEMASLQVVTELEAADECSAEGIIPRRARDIQRAVGPGTTDVGTQIEPGPIVEHRGRINWSRDWHIGRRGGIYHANVKKGANQKRTEVAPHVPTPTGAVPSFSVSPFSARVRSNWSNRPRHRVSLWHRTEAKFGIKIGAIV